MCFKIYVPRKKTQASTRGDDRGNFFFLLLTPFFSSANVSSNFCRRQFIFDLPSSFFSSFLNARANVHSENSISLRRPLFTFTRETLSSRVSNLQFLFGSRLYFVITLFTHVRVFAVELFRNGRGEKKKKKKEMSRSQTGLKVFFKHRKNSKNAHLPRIVRGRYIIIGIIIVRFQSGCRLLSVAQTRDSEWVNDIKPRRLFVKRDIASFFTRRCLPWLP